MPANDPQMIRKCIDCMDTLYCVHAYCACHEDRIGPIDHEHGIEQLSIRRPGLSLGVDVLYKVWDGIPPVKRQPIEESNAPTYERYPVDGVTVHKCEILVKNCLD